MRLSLAVAAAMLMMCLSGCVAVQRGNTQVKWEPDMHESRVIPALETGQYALLKGSDYKPQYIVNVNRGEDLGFRMTNGHLFAVYGSKQDELSDKSARYYWNYRGK